MRFKNCIQVLISFPMKLIHLLKQLMMRDKAFAIKRTKAKAEKWKEI